jgi:hypothetical protein
MYASKVFRVKGSSYHILQDSFRVKGTSHRIMRDIFKVYFKFCQGTVTWYPITKKFWTKVRHDISFICVTHEIQGFFSEIHIRDIIFIAKSEVGSILVIFQESNVQNS